MIDFRFPLDKIIDRIEKNITDNVLFLLLEIKEKGEKNDTFKCSTDSRNHCE